jgi:hypothetical protein
VIGLIRASETIGMESVRSNPKQFTGVINGRQRINNDRVYRLELMVIVFMHNGLDNRYGPTPAK